MNEFLALLLSAAIEAPVAWVVITLTRWPSRGRPHVAAASAVATAVTHPQLWAAIAWLAPHYGWWPSTAVAELAVVLVEAVLIAWMAQMRLRYALAVSLIANGASFGLGLLLGF